MTDSLLISASRMGRARVFPIARYTLLEARRNRFMAIVLIVIALVFLLSIFARELAIIESDRVQTVVLAAGLRAAMVLVVCIYVLQGLQRDANDKILEMMMSFDMPRWHYLLGKFTGHMLLALACAAVAALPLLYLADPAPVAAWACSLALELWIVIAASMFCITAFSQLMPAAVFVLGFYLLARAITAIQFMSHSSLAAPGGHTELASVVADALAFVLPRLDAFTQSAWLVGAQSVAVSPVSLLSQAIVFTGLLLVAAMIDLQRAEL